MTWMLAMWDGDEEMFGASGVWCIDMEVVRAVFSSQYLFEEMGEMIVSNANSGWENVQ